MPQVRGLRQLSGVREMTKEIGTLQELNVKPGDVVEYTAIGEPNFKPTTFTFQGWSNGRPYSEDEELGGMTSLRTDSDAVFRIISRASETQRPKASVSPAHS